jgi:uncharacterized protein YbjT (DUF2867 family)
VSEILVTGATGDLGRELLPALRAAGHSVRAMSRRPGGSDTVVADLSTGAGVTEAVAGVDTVIHAASDPRGDTKQTDVEGTRRLVEAAANVRHLIYVSIVGVDRNPYPYYRAKHEAERIVARAGIPYSIVRAAQFHDLIAHLLQTRLKRGPLLFMPIGWAAQPLAAADLGEHLVRQVADGPSNRMVEFVGPARLSGHEMLRAWRAAGHQRGPAVPVLLRGEAARAFRMKSNIGSPDALRGRIGWAQWLRENPRLADLASRSHDAG